MKTVEELTKELEDERSKAKALESKSQRLEDESKSFKARAQDAESKLTDAEKDKLKEAGKLEDLLALEKKQNKELNDKWESTRSQVLTERLRTEVSKHAKDAHDVDMILKVKDHSDLLKLDEDNLTVDGVKEFTSAVRESHSYLFKKQKLDETEDKKPKEEKPLTDTEKYHAALDACNSQADLEKVKKQYGKA